MRLGVGVKVLLLGGLVALGAKGQQGVIDLRLLAPGSAIINQCVVFNGTVWAAGDCSSETLTAAAPLVKSVGGEISLPAATGSADGYLDSEDWTTFNGKAAGDHTHSGTYEPVVGVGTTGQYYRGDKSWQTLDKTAVGLGNVDNTADASKNVATAGALAANPTACPSGQYVSDIAADGTLTCAAVVTDLNPATLTEIADPDAPAANAMKWYAYDIGGVTYLCAKNSDGETICVAPSGVRLNSTSPTTITGKHQTGDIVEPSSGYTNMGFKVTTGVPVFRVNGGTMKDVASTDQLTSNPVTAASTIGDGKLVVGSGGSRGVAASTLTGVMKSASGTPSAAGYADVAGLWASGLCSGYLKSDGTCDTPEGAEESYTITTDDTTARTLAAGDNATIIRFTSGSAVTVTVPTGLGAGFNCIIEQYGAGTVSFTASGTTLRQFAGTAAIAGQYGKVMLYADTDSIFQLAGHLAGGVTAAQFGTQTANYVLSGPTSGAAAVPTFRALAAGDIPSLAAVSETLTNKTIDAEGTGNSVTLTSKMWLEAAGCQNATAGLMWDTPTSNPAVAACVTGTNTQKGVAAFADGASLSMQRTLALPADWTGAIDAQLKWYTSGTSGSVVWQIATSCVADAETDDPSWNTASTVTDAAKGTTNQVNDAAITGITATGCAAGELLHVKVLRDAAHASDDLAATANLIGVELTIRRTM